MLLKKIVVEGTGCEMKKEGWREGIGRRWRFNPCSSELERMPNDRLTRENVSVKEIVTEFSLRVVFFSELDEGRHLRVNTFQY